jgi:hypothetical protein
MTDSLDPQAGLSRCSIMENSQIPDGAPGAEESHMDRAMRGPTPDNPSLSLKARLKRAAFFDKREREVAAGEAQPVDPEAGLPEAGVEEGFDEGPEDAPDTEGRPLPGSGA